MAVVEPLTEEHIEPDLLEQIQFFKGPLGVIPNSVRTMARKPHLAKAFTELNKAVMTCEGQVTPEFKRLIGYVTSFVAGCRYCQAHTIRAAERYGAADEQLANVWEYRTHPAFSEAERAALALAFASGTQPNAATDAHFERLAEHFDEREQVEIMAVIAMFGFLNRWNDTLATSLENEPAGFAADHLASKGWERGAH